MLDKIKEAAKAIAGLVLLILTALTGTVVEEPAARWIAIGIAVAGAIIIWATPNKETDEQQRVRLAGEQALLDEQAERETNTALSYAESGGGDYPIDSSPDAEYPNSETLYEPGEKEGERFGNEVPLDEVSGNTPKGPWYDESQYKTVPDDIPDDLGVEYPVSGND